VWQAAYGGLLAATPPLEACHITAPTLVLSGDADDILPRSQADALVGAIPGARLVVYEDCGHLVLWERSERVAADVLAFVRAVTSCS
jgi:rifampin ADP-ribosylating transferase